jgi:signal transduction histidine kinase
LRIAVALNGGGYAVFETHGEISRRIFGLPPGFWIGVLGSLVGIAALFAVWREARPLKALSQAVARFASDGEPHRVPLRGAPELRRLIEAVNRMQERIATLLKGRSVLLGAVSHDLKTYITRLKLRAEMIEDLDQRARAARDLDEMTALIEDALAVARGTAAHDRVCVIDLAELLRTTCLDHPSVRLIVPSGSVEIEGDPVAMRRLFDNLLDNAMRYGGGRATVDVTPNVAGWRITVDDHGPGIPEKERELAFEPFYRRETSRSRETGGSGLGLAIVRQIVELHGGTIKLGEAPSGGLRVSIELPSHR